jgi:hypothetical protein
MKLPRPGARGIDTSVIKHPLPSLALGTRFRLQFSLFVVAEALYRAGTFYLANRRILIARTT